jgi:hypothetical protein
MIGRMIGTPIAGQQAVSAFRRQDYFFMEVTQIVILELYGKAG